MNNPLVQPDPGLFIWTIITFLVLLLLLAKFAWKPLLAALEARREAIRKSLDDAQQAKLELERLHQESDRILKQARMDAAEIVSQSRSDAQNLREELNKKAQTEAEGIVKSAQKTIQIETQKALAQIRGEVVDLSVSIASRLLERNVSKEDNIRLIDETLKQIEATTKQ
jgi:F-type H+-transporting ATPase subunit b